MNLLRWIKSSLGVASSLVSPLRRGQRVVRPTTQNGMAVACFLLSLLTVAYGQETGIMKGTVEDSTGTAIPEAVVTLQHVATGKHFSEATDEDGYFQIEHLPLGQYAVSVNSRGFETWSNSIQVGAKASPTMLIRMKIAQYKIQVTVKAQAESAPSALDNADYLELDQTSLQHLPILEGDPLAIPSLFLEPAVMGAQGPQLIVDGVEATSPELPTSAIKAIYVNKSPYTAEYSRPGRGRIEVLTRQGSRHHYRGSVGFLLRNSALDARNAFAPTRPLLQRPIGEAQLSGPLNSRISFFLAGRYVHSNQDAVINAVTPQGILIENYPVHEVDAHGFGRLDFKLSGHHLATLSYKYKDKSKQNQNVGGFNLPSRATDTLDRENEIRFFETATVTESFLNEARFTYKRQPVSTVSLSDSRAIYVLGAFITGGAQQTQRLQEQVGVAQDIATVVEGKHTLRFGFAVRPRFFDATNATNFGGTFRFSSLERFAESRPYVFSQNLGNPYVSYHQVEYSSFIQDEARLWPSLSLSLGVRHEFQSDLGYHKNVAPRVALAYAPGSGETVIRAGAGLFYDRLPGVMDEQSLLYTANHILQVVVPDPSYPVPFSPPDLIYSAKPSVTRIASGIRTPCQFQSNLSIERKLGKGRNYLTLDYTTVRGFRLYRTRNLNQPLPTTDLPPYDGFINIDQFESSGSSRGNMLVTTFKTSPNPRFDLMVEYTYSHTDDDTSGYSSLPANNYDLRSEWGRSDLDRRHRLNLICTYKLPFALRYGTVVALNSGIPYNVTTGFDNYQDTVANARPPGVNRNTGRGPGFAELDVHLSRAFHPEKNKHRPRIEVGIDAFNVLNSVNYKNYVGTMTSPYFGHPIAANMPREIQLSVGFLF